MTPRLVEQMTPELSVSQVTSYGLQRKFSQLLSTRDKSTQITLKAPVVPKVFLNFPETLKPRPEMARNSNSSLSLKVPGARRLQPKFDLRLHSSVRSQ